MRQQKVALKAQYSVCVSNFLTIVTIDNNLNLPNRLWPLSQGVTTHPLSHVDRHVGPPRLTATEPTKGGTAESAELGTIHALQLWCGFVVTVLFGLAVGQREVFDS